MKIGLTYIIRIELSDGRLFTYIGKLISEDNEFIEFIDKNGKTWNYNKSKVISMEEA